MVTINWKKIPGNKSMIKLHPLMLTEEGYVIKRKFSVGRGVETRTALVVYDTDYVYFRFKELIEQLQFKNKETQIEFINSLPDKLYD
jgi:hypothetical protein